MSGETEVFRGPEDPTAAEEHRFLLTAGGLVAVSRPSPSVGRVNEDAWLVVLGGEELLLAVADGVGGSRAGLEAAQALLETLAAAAAAAAPAGASMRHAVLEALERGNERIMERHAGSACTFACVVVRNGEAQSVHVGDAEVAILGGRGREKFRTVSHSPVGHAIEAGLLDQEDALRHEDRHIVSNAVGCRDMRIEIGPSVPLARLDTVLVGSDGLFDNLRIEEISALACRGPSLRAARGLADAASERMLADDADHPSKIDDLTFLLARPGRS